MNARRFLWRWSLRMLRLEWRQHLGVMALVAGSVAISIGAVVAAFNLSEPPGFRFGDGHVRAVVTGGADDVITAVEAQGHRYGIVEWGVVRTPGARDGIEVRAFYRTADRTGDGTGADGADVDETVTAPLLRLIDGRRPEGPDEVAVTDDIPVPSRTIGWRLELGGRQRTVVGVVENPTDLRDEFVLVDDLDGYGIEPVRRSTVILVDADPADVTFPAGVGSISTESRGGAADPAVRTMIAIAVSAVTAVAMLVVALLVGASFAVLARRRSRQYGLLAAAGAEPRRLRQLALSHGFLVGAASAAVGAAVGLAVVAATVPRMETTVAHRIDLSVPWWSVVPTLALAVISSSIAAWWPARRLSRQPVVEVLASTRPQPAATTGTTRVGLMAVVLGTVGLVVGTNRLSLPLVLVGITSALIGFLLLAPVLVHAVGRHAGRLPLPARMAGRAIARYQSRSAALVAALAIALGIPVGLATVTASIDARNRETPLNLSPELAIAWLPGAADDTVEIPADLDPEAAATALDRLVAAVPRATITPIQVAYDPDDPLSESRFDDLGPAPAIIPTFAVRPFDGSCGATCDVNTLGDRDENGNEIELTFHEAWVADPGLLDALGIGGTGGSTASDGIDDSTSAISPYEDAMLSSHRGQADGLAPNMAVEETMPVNTSIAAALIRPRTVTDNGWETVTVGWIVGGDQPFSSTELEALADAVDDDLILETMVEPTRHRGIRAAGVTIGGLISLGILLAALSLLGADSANDLRILQAIGAGPSHHRRLSAATAAILVGAGVVIAIPTGHLALIVLLADRQSNYPFAVPWSSLFTVAVVVPAVAAAIGWAGSRTRTTKLATPIR